MVLDVVVVVSRTEHAKEMADISEDCKNRVSQPRKLTNPRTNQPNPRTNQLILNLRSGRYKPLQELKKESTINLQIKDIPTDEVFPTGF
ncbi:hypothetical protein TNCV_2172791 [Trichonephila clavipes]|nr:hypothetical protein TNCV_2172791 [Trichonephila clavipes]